MSPSFNARLSVSTPIFALRDASLIVYICIHSPPFVFIQHGRPVEQCQEDEARNMRWAVWWGSYWNELMILRVIGKKQKGSRHLTLIPFSLLTTHNLFVYNTKIVLKYK